MTKDYVISLEVNDSGAIQNIDKLEQSLESTNKSATNVKAELRQIQRELANLPQGSKEFDALSQKAGKLQDQINDASEAIKANAGNAFESLSNNVGNLGNRFQNLDFEGLTSDFRGISTSIKGVKLDDLSNGLKAVAGGFLDLGKALLANPIFLIGAAIAALVLNFDAIKETLDLGVTPAMRDLAESTREASEASKQALEAFDLEERRLRALGVSEEEIATQRRARTVQRIKDLKLEFEAAQTIANSQRKEFAENLKAAESGNLLDKFVAGVSLTFGPGLEDISNSQKAADEISKESEKLNVILLELDKKTTDGQKAENDKRIADNRRVSDERKIASAANQKILDDEKAAELKNQQEISDLVNQLMQENIDEAAKIASDAEKARLDALVKANEERIAVQDLLFKNESDLFATEQEKQIDAVNAKYEAFFLAAANNAEAEIQLTAQRDAEIKAINDKAAADKIATEKQVTETKLQLAAQSFTAIADLITSFQAKDAEAAKKQFAISKAFNLAAALTNTYLAVTAALATTKELFPGQRFVTAGIAGTVGLAQVAKIASTKYGASSGGGGGSSISTSGGGSGGSGGGQSGPPTFNPLNTAFLQNRPPQAAPTYVISGTVTNAQQADQKINELARL